MRSAYMEWVKTSTQAKYNLANSGVLSFPLEALPVDFSALRLTGPGAYGYRPLLEAIAHKCNVPADCVATTLGTSGANHLAMSVLIAPGDEVLVEFPSYPLIWETAEYLGAKIVHFERRASEQFGVDVEELSHKVSARTKLIVLTNLHNPSCAYIDEDTIRAIGRVARQVGARVLIDEVYLDLLFEKAPPTAYKFGPEFIVTNSLTKVYGLSGVRCGWVIAEPSIIHAIYRLNDLFGVNNPYVTDQISCVALAHLDEIGRWSRKLLDTNLAIANEFLATTPQLNCPPLGVGTVLFPEVPVPVNELCETLKKDYETVITPGKFFGAPQRVRIGIGGETSLLREGLGRIREVLKTLQATRIAAPSTAPQTAGLA